MSKKKRKFAEHNIKYLEKPLDYVEWHILKRACILCSVSFIISADWKVFWTCPSEAVKSLFMRSESTRQSSALELNETLNDIQRSCFNSDINTDAKCNVMEIPFFMQLGTIIKIVFPGVNSTNLINMAVFSYCAHQMLIKLSTTVPNSHHPSGFHQLFKAFLTHHSLSSTDPTIPLQSLTFSSGLFSAVTGIPELTPQPSYALLSGPWPPHQLWALFHPLRIFYIFSGANQLVQTPLNGSWIISTVPNCP